MKHLQAFESTFFTKSSYIAKGKSENFPRVLLRVNTVNNSRN